MRDTGIVQIFSFSCSFREKFLISPLKSVQNTGLCHKSVADPGFPRGGANPKGLFNWHNFSRKLLENEKKTD